MRINALMNIQDIKGNELKMGDMVQVAQLYGTKTIRYIENYTNEKVCFTQDVYELTWEKHRFILRSIIMPAAYLELHEFSLFNEKGQNYVPGYGMIEEASEKFLIKKI